MKTATSSSHSSIRKHDLGALRAADPVALPRLDRVGPVDRLEIVEQRLRVVGDPEEPLLHQPRLDLGAAALAGAVRQHLLVREHGLVVRAPLDRRRPCGRRGRARGTSGTATAASGSSRARASRARATSRSTSRSSASSARIASMFRSTISRGWPPSRIAAFSDGQPERVEPDRVEDADSRSGAGSGSRRRRSCRRACGPCAGCRTGRGAARARSSSAVASDVAGIRDREGLLVLPDALPLRLDRLRVVSLGHRRHLAQSFRGYKKASRERGRGKLPRRRRVRFLRYGRSCFTGPNASTVPGNGQGRGRRADDRRTSRATRAGRAVRDAARRLLRAVAARAGAALSRAPRPTRSSSTGRRRSRTSRCCGCSRRRASAPTSRRSASSRSRGRPGSRASGSSSTATTSRTRSCAPAAELGALVVLDALDEPERAAAAGVRRALVRVTPGVEAETHEAIRTGHRGSKFGLDADDALEAIRRARAAGHRGRRAARPRRLAAPRRRARICWRSSCSRSSRGAAATSSTGRRRSSTSAAASGSGTCSTSRSRRSSELVRDDRRRGRARAWEARGLPQPRLILEPGRSLVGPAAVHALHASARSSGPASGATSRSTAACPTTRARSSTAPATRRCSRTAPTRSRRRAVRGRRQALRVGRRPDRARPRCRSRGAATCSPCRRRAPTRSRWARTTTACRGRRPCSCATARRARSCGARRSRTCWRARSDALDRTFPYVPPGAPRVSLPKRYRGWRHAGGTEGSRFRDISSTGSAEVGPRGGGARPACAGSRQQVARSA